MSSDGPAVRVEGLGKRFQIYERPSDRLKSFFMPRLRAWTGRPPRAYCRDFWALRDISFDVGKGETVGILGRNGAGKSTLLQLICGTLAPTRGQVVTHGRIAALLELGSGFNPEFTGRDNVFMNAALLGLTKRETEARYDAIVEFADIGDFVNQPVKTYSSGMMVRLAFAVQAQVEPDILIVDEALAVGDAKFQARCFERLRQLKDNGTSILLVTHSTDQIVTHCSRAILLSDGGVLESGDPRRVANRYLDLLFGRERKVGLAPASAATASDASTAPRAAFALSYGEDAFAQHPGYNPHEYRWGDGSAAILDFYLAADDELYPAVVTSGQKIRLGVAVRFHRELVRPILGVTVKTKEGVTVYGANSETLDAGELKVLGQSDTFVAIEMDFTCRLAQGDYFISLGVATRVGEDIVPHDRRYDSIHLHVGPGAQFFGIADLDLSFKEISASS